MKVQKVGQPLTCPECGQGGKKHLFKIRGQSTFKCPDCLAFHSVMLGPSKTAEIDAVNSADNDDDGDEPANSRDSSGNG